MLVLIKTLGGRLRELKNKGKVQLSNPRSRRGRLQERLLTRAFYCKVYVTVQMRFHKGGRDVTRAGHFREWSQGELRLYVFLGGVMLT